MVPYRSCSIGRGLMGTNCATLLAEEDANAWVKIQLTLMVGSSNAEGKVDFVGCLVCCGACRDGTKYFGFVLAALGWFCQLAAFLRTG